MPQNIAPVDRGFLTFYFKKNHSKIYITLEFKLFLTWVWEFFDLFIMIFFIIEFDQE
jgi:hypothetical protein